MVERMAVVIFPECHTFAFPDTRSVATQAKGIGSLLKSSESYTLLTMH